MSGDRILVIDNSKEIARHLTQTLLPELGYRTLHAFDGRTGLDLIRHEALVLVMVELDLPDMGGVELLKAMRSASLHVPVILMAAYGSEKQVSDGFRLGIGDYLIKPFTKEELVTALQRVIPTPAPIHTEERRHASEVRKLKSPSGADERLGHDLRRQLSQIKVLFGIGKAVTSLLSVEQILERVLDAATYLTGAEESVVWLPESKSGRLRAYARKSGTDDKQILSLSMRDSQVAHVLRTGRPQRMTSGADGYKVQTGYLARALMSVPLTVRGKVVGVLSVVNRLKPQSFSERDEYLLTSLADYAAIALHNARIYQATDRALAGRADELRTLIEITRQITSSLDLGEIVRRTLRQVHDSWEMETSSLWLIDEERQMLELLDTIGGGMKETKMTTVPIGRGILGYVAQSGQPVASSDAARHPFYEADIDDAGGAPARTLLCVPLLYREQMIGLLQLVNKLSGTFEEADVERLQSLGTAVAIALRNALDYEWIAGQQEELEKRLRSIRSTALELKRKGALEGETEALLAGIIEASTQVSDLATGMLTLPGFDLPEE